MNQKITFPELIELMARRQKCSKREAENFLRELMTLMSDVISTGETMKINSLGTFKSVWVEDRVSVNVQTGEPYTIPGHYKLTFTPTKQVRDAVNEPFACFAVEVLPDDAPILTAERQESNDMVDNDDEVQDEIVSREEEKAEDKKAVVEQCEQAHLTPECEPEENSCVISDSVEPSNIVVEEKTEDTVTEIEEDCAVIAIDEEVEDTPIIPTEEETAPSHTDDENNIGDNDKDNAISSTYRKGLFTGIAVATTIFAIALLLIYLYMARFATSADQQPISVPFDTLQVEEAIADTLAMQQDTLVVDTLPLHVEEEALPSAISPLQVDTIRKGVFLTNISLKHYGHKAFWVYIYEENKNIISNPDLIPIGTVVVIPSAQKYGINAADSASVNRAKEIADEIKARKGM